MPRNDNDIDYSHSHTFIYPVSFQYLPTFRSHAAIVSEKSIVGHMTSIMLIISISLYLKAIYKIWLEMAQGFLEKLTLILICKMTLDQGQEMTLILNTYIHSFIHL